MSDGFGISADTAERDVDYEIDDNNFLKDFIRFSRDNQVLNEQQSAVVQMAIATGFMDSYDFFTSIIVTGGSAGGKSHMLDEVNFEALEYADDVHDHVYELSGGSDKAAIDAEEIDDALVAYFHELQKIPDEMLEFIKTVAEDGAFRYGRNVADPDSATGRTTEHIEREPLPVVFSFADENQSEAGDDQELRTRTVEVKVDENPEKNAAVHDMKWGGERITLEDSRHEYIRDDTEAEERAHAVKAHLRDMPVGVDATIPYGNNKHDEDDWCAAAVVRPMFNFAATESTRASTNIAGLTMGSALLNYHARDYVCQECSTVYGPDEAKDADYECPSCEDSGLEIIVSPIDVANIIMCRNTLLATTHGLTDKKFAVLDAIREVGGQANASGTAVQATKQDIIEEIQRNDNIATLTKSEIGQILDELDENLIINKTDNPQDRRENLYVYDGSETFDAPDIYGPDGERYSLFEDVEDVIEGQPIEQTIEQQLEELNAKMDSKDLTTAEAMGGAESGDTTLSAVGDTTVSNLDEIEQQVAQKLLTTIDGKTIPQDVMAENSLKTGHMVGDSPIRTEGDTVRPERPPKGSDKVEGFMAPDGIFADEDSIDAVEKRVDEAIATLRQQNVLQMSENDDGSVDVEVAV